MGATVVHNRFAALPVLRGRGWLAWLLFFTCTLLLPVSDCLFAQNSPQQLQITYRDQLLDIYARNVDIKDFFVRLAEKANITIEYPVSLDKKITVDREDISLKKFLTNFLRNMNHVIIYSGSNGKNSRVSEVHIFPTSTRSRSSGASTSYSSGRSRDLLRRRIDNYRKTVEKLRSALSSVGEDKYRRQTYLNRIQGYEERIKNLENQLY